jgi:hypothetical protein
VGDTSSVMLTQCIVREVECVTDGQPCRDHGLICETQYVRKKVSQG